MTWCLWLFNSYLYASVMASINRIHIYVIVLANIVLATYAIFLSGLNVLKITSGYFRLFFEPNNNKMHYIIYDYLHYKIIPNYSRVI